MYNPKISVIIPVYNAEKYLEHCINSVLLQTFFDFELLLIDDFSSDKSLDICNEFAKIDKRVKVSHKVKNEGTAQARKTGIQKAVGKYTLFIDNDDWISPETLKCLYLKAESDGYDMVYCDYFSYKDKDNVVYCNQNIKHSNTFALMKDIVAWGEFFPATWNKLIKTDIYKKISFPKITFSEDRNIIFQVLFYCNNIGYINKAFYYWRTNPYSASSSIENSIKNIIEDYISNTYILLFAKNNLLDINELCRGITDHLRKLSFFIPNKNKILRIYNASIQNIANMSSETEILSEQNKTIENFKKYGKMGVYKKTLKVYFYRVLVFLSLISREKYKHAMRKYS